MRLQATDKAMFQPNSKLSRLAWHFVPLHWPQRFFGCTARDFLFAGPLNPAFAPIFPPSLTVSVSQNRTDHLNHQGKTPDVREIDVEFIAFATP